MKLELIIDLSIFLSFIFISVQDINYVLSKIESVFVSWDYLSRWFAIFLDLWYLIWNYGLQI